MALPFGSSRSCLKPQTFFQESVIRKTPADTFQFSTIDTLERSRRPLKQCRDEGTLSLSRPSGDPDTVLRHTVQSTEETSL